MENYKEFCSEILKKSEKAAKIAAKKKWSFFFGLACFIIIAIAIVFINAHSIVSQNALIFFCVFYIIVLAVFQIFFPVSPNNEELNRACKKIIKDEVDELNDILEYRKIIAANLESQLYKEYKNIKSVRSRLFFFEEVSRTTKKEEFDLEISYLKKHAN